MPFINRNEIEVNTIFPGFKAKFIHSEKMTIAYIEIKKDSILPTHSHPHEQVNQVLSGQLEIIIEGVSQILDSGLVAVIPSNVSHSGRVVTDCVALDAFTPVREDFKAL